MAHYLPGDIRDRIRDLMKQKKITQSALAHIAGLDESAFSRFLNGKTQAIGPEQLIRIAREFRVTTDFLLRIVDVPDKTNYDISELGFLFSIQVHSILKQRPSLRRDGGLISLLLPR